MKRGITFGILVLVALVVYMSPGITWAEDTHSRIYQLEIRVDDIESQLPYLDADTLDSLDSTDFALSDHSHAGNSSTQYLSLSFLGGTSHCSWPVYNFWDTIDDEYSQFANADTSVSWMGRSAVYWPSETWACNVWIPVELPDGAVVVEVGILYYDETDGDPAISASLMRNMGDTTTGDLGFTLKKIIPSTSGDPNLPQYAWSPCVKGARCVIDNARFGYHIKGNIWGGENMALISAFVGYKMP